MERHDISLQCAWDSIRDSDLLLWRGPGLISKAGIGEHYHASKLAWWDNDLMVLDMTAAKGGDIRLLTTDVQRYSGYLDWFEVNPYNLPYDRAGAIRYMRRLVDTRYGYFSLLRASLVHLPFVRLAVGPELNDEYESTYPPYCSEAAAGSDRIGGGHDPVPYLADRLVEPAYLARSEFYKYRGTLIWPDETDSEFLAWLEEHSATNFPCRL